MDKKMRSEEVIHELEDFVKNPKGNFLFVGATGRGKSFCARFIYEKLARFKLPYRDWDQAWFITQADLNAMWVKEIADRGHAFDLMDQAKKSWLFILDDLGTRSPSPTFADFLYAIMDFRYEARDRKVTVVTTNLTATQIREQFGDAFFSRIASGVQYIFQGADRRFTERAI